jgi:DeoR/GlpR family transcriptional regulator of sugar metabolism
MSEAAAARPLGEERRRAILELVRTHGRVRAADLARDLGVSPDTVRRDLDELAAAGLVRRVHGGALPAAPPGGGWAARRAQDPATKAGIARAAAGLARDGDVILLDGGTTTLQVAHHLAADLRATVLTNSPPIAVALAGHPSVQVCVIGGTLDKAALVTVGAAALDALRAVRADLCYLGVCGLHPEVGITTTELEERHVKRAMIDGSTRVVALADADKLGTAGPFVVGPLGDLTHLVTERRAPREVVAAARAQGVEVVRA